VSYGLAFDAILQLATGLALVFYFRKDLICLFWQREIGLKFDWKLIKFLIIGTLPAILLGLIFQKYIETSFRNIVVIALTLLVGSIIMYLSEKFIKQSELNYRKTFVVGLFQALALIPGMSRSGMTISGAYFMGIKKELAIRFSFLLSIPIILGSGSYELLKLLKE
jgi:undecaprenyl-diphosphatase